MIKKSIIIDEELYNKAKSAAASKGQDLMTPDGWIADAIKWYLTCNIKDREAQNER